MNIEELMENARLKGRVIALEAELESEKAAHKALRSLSFTTAVPSEDYEKLKAELAKSEEHNAALCERLQDLNSELHTASCANANAHKEINRLKAEVERLRKAGDEMASLFGGDFSDNDGVCYDKKWNAAKEGKPSV